MSDDQQEGAKVDYSDAAQVAASMSQEDDGWKWVIVEVMGHRRHVGRAREVEMVGVKMLRVDVPIKGDPVANGWETFHYGGSALFGLHLTTEANAMKENKPFDSAYRHQLPPPRDDSHDDEYED